MGSGTENLLRTHLVSYIAKILCLYKQTIEWTCVQTKLYIQELRYMHVYLLSCIKKLLESIYFKQFQQCLYAGQDCWFIINNHQVVSVLVFCNVYMVYKLIDVMKKYMCMEMHKRTFFTECKICLVLAAK